MGNGVLSLALIASSLRMATPLIFVAVGAVFIYSAGVLNIGLEGSMLLGSFFAVVIGYWTQSLALGFIFAGIAGMILSWLLAFLIIKMRTEPIVVGLGGNLLAWGITVFILEEFFGLRGAFNKPEVPSFRVLNIEMLENIPVLGDLLSGYTLLVFLGWAVTLVCWIVLYKTPIGLKTRAIGENEDTARTIGINVKRIQTGAFLVSGFFAGLGGAYLSIADMQGFWSENMTAGRGFIAICALAFGKNNPKWVFVACLFFGFANALGIRLQSLQWHPSLILMMPYIFTILILGISSLKKRVL